MVERVKDPWKTSDGATFASRAEAEKHEGRVELADWLTTALMAASDAPVNAEPIAQSLAGKIVDSGVFVALLRKAGVPLIVRERTAKVKPPAAPKKPAKVAAE